MGTVFGRCVGVVAVAVAVAAPIAVGQWQASKLRNFDVVRPRVLYRSAQLSPAGLARLVQDHGIRTVVNLRDGSSPADQVEEKFCLDRGLKFVRIWPHEWDGVQGTASVEKGLTKFLDVVRDPANQPVLVHCFRGVHRTGAYVAVYRVEFEGWTVERALAEMVGHGYVQLDEHIDVKGYFASYRRTGRYDR